MNDDAIFAWSRRTARDYTTGLSIWRRDTDYIWLSDGLVLVRSDDSRRIYQDVLGYLPNVGAEFLIHQLRIETQAKQPIPALVERIETATDEEEVLRTNWIYTYKTDDESTDLSVFTHTNGNLITIQRQYVDLLDPNRDYTYTVVPIYNSGRAIVAKTADYHVVDIQRRTPIYKQFPDKAVFCAMEHTGAVAIDELVRR